MRRKPSNTDFYLVLACMVAFVAFCALGLSGNLPGQCAPGADLLVCQK